MIRVELRLEVCDDRVEGVVAGPGAELRFTGWLELMAHLMALEDDPSPAPAGAPIPAGRSCPSEARWAP